MKFSRWVLLLLFSAGVLFADSYVVDKSHTSVAFKVKHMMITNVRGNFNDFKGSFSLEKGKLTALKAVIQVASVDTDNIKRDKHLIAKDFFDAEWHPEITFTAKKIGADSVVGDLTIRDVTKSIKLDLEYGGEVDDPWGNHRAGLELNGKINRSDFGLKWNKLLEAGGVAVAEKVKLIIEIEGVRK